LWFCVSYRALRGFRPRWQLAVAVGSWQWRALAGRQALIHADYRPSHYGTQTHKASLPGPPAAACSAAAAPPAAACRLVERGGGGAGGCRAWAVEHELNGMWHEARQGAHSTRVPLRHAWTKAAQRRLGHTHYALPFRVSSHTTAAPPRSRELLLVCLDCPC
jgi:hypothetical protein